MTRTELQEVFHRFSGVNALVVGDVMVDSYLWGRVERISPEAPVPVVSVIKKENRLGGAANVAVNIRALGGQVIMCSVTGADEGRMVIDKLLKENGIETDGMISSEDRITTVKTRVISSHQHMVRIDEEKTSALREQDELKFIQRVQEIMINRKVHVLLFEDYNKGVLTPRVISELSAFATKQGIPVAVDPKKDNFFHYKGVTLFKPNLKELTEGLKLDERPSDLKQLTDACNRLEDELGHRISLITLSEKGVFVKDGERVGIVPAHIRNISDVSGAGDTVFAVASLCLALNMDPVWMARLANLSGGLVCEHVGVVPIDIQHLKREALALLPS